jgi:hypothetical protein
MTDCRHRWFLASWRQNEAALSKRFDDNWMVRCTHCGNVIARCQKYVCGEPVGSPAIIDWSHDGSTWFGSFGIAT